MITLNETTSPTQYFCLSLLLAAIGRGVRKNYLA